MKTTPLERLIKADLIFQVQQKYNRSICKRADKLKHHAQELQKCLEDDKRRKERQRVNEKEDDNLLPLFDAMSYKFISRVTNMVLDDLELMMKRHDIWKEHGKKVFKEENISYKMHELKTLLADDQLGLYLKKSSIPPLCKTVSYWKNIYYGCNRQMMSTLKKQENNFRFVERMVYLMNTEASV